jgi:hypothetical protein
MVNGCPYESQGVTYVLDCTEIDETVVRLALPGQVAERPLSVPYQQRKEG